MESKVFCGRRCGWIGAGLEQANKECGASWEGCNTRSASTGCSAFIPQCHRHHHNFIIMRDAWGPRHMVPNWEFRHSCSQSLPYNLHPIPCHPKIKCMGTGYKFPGFLRSLLYATENKNTFNPPPPTPLIVT